MVAVVWPLADNSEMRPYESRAPLPGWQMVHTHKQGGQYKPHCIWGGGGGLHEAGSSSKCTEATDGVRGWECVHCAADDLNHLFCFVQRWLLAILLSRPPTCVDCCFYSPQER